MAKKKPRKKRKKVRYVKPRPTPKPATNAVLEITADQQYKIVINKEGFDKLRHNPEFIQILNLSRVSNSLSFCYQSIIDAGQSETPAKRRHLYYASTFANAVLFEGLTCAKKLEDYFFDRKTYTEGLGVLLNDPITREIMEKGSRFDKIRNRVTFHFNPTIFEDVLTWAEFDSYIFGMGQGPHNGGFFFTLPEDLALNFIVGGKHEDDEGKEIYNKMQADIVSVMVRFFNAAQDLISEFLVDKGWTVELVAQTTNTEAVQTVENSEVNEETPINTAS
jgi:hypothetical protein